MTDKIETVYIQVSDTFLDDNEMLSVGDLVLTKTGALLSFMACGNGNHAGYDGVFCSLQDAIENAPVDICPNCKIIEV